MAAVTLSRSAWIAGAVASVLIPTAALCQGDGAGGAGSKATYYRAPSTAAANLPFSDSVRVGRLLYINNQIGNEPGVAHVVSGGLAAELGQTMKNIGVIVKASGLEMSDVFKCTVSLADMSKWAEFNRLWPTYFSADHLPVRNVIGVTALPLGGVVGVECTANGR